LEIQDQPVRATLGSIKVAGDGTGAMTSATQNIGVISEAMEALSAEISYHWEQPRRGADR
jgi:hypothetical protein